MRYCFFSDEKPLISADANNTDLNVTANTQIAYCSIVENYQTKDSNSSYSLLFFVILIAE